MAPVRDNHFTAALALDTANDRVWKALSIRDARRATGVSYTDDGAESVARGGRVRW
mgnify:CR=1 FL=1